MVIVATNSQALRILTQEGWSREAAEALVAWTETRSQELQEPVGLNLERLKRTITEYDCVVEAALEQGWDGPLSPLQTTEALRWLRENFWVLPTETGILVRTGEDLVLATERRER